MAFRYGVEPGDRERIRNFFHSDGAFQIDFYYDWDEGDEYFIADVAGSHVVGTGPSDVLTILCRIIKES